MSDIDKYDYIVIGAGSAGSVVAGRLSADGRSTVLLLEAGPESRNPWIDVPVGTPKLFDDPSITWGYESCPEPGLNGRKLYQPRGRLVGGTGAINGMAYVRGHRLDFDNWRRAGNVGWNYDDLLPYFKRSEDNVRGENAFHATGGPMHVADQRLHRTIGTAFVEAGQQMGYVYNDDFNGIEQEGVGYFQWNYRKGRRINPASAYLGRKRPNLRIVTRAVVDRIEFEGNAAVGVRYLVSNTTAVAKARREIVLSAGSFNSPQILQRSGVGPLTIMRQHGVPVVADLPGVGRNYQDHFTIQVAFKSNLRDTLNDDIGTLYRRACMGAAYLFGRRGPMAHTGTYAGGFIRTCPTLEQPDIELNCNLWTRKYAKKGGGLLDRFSGFTILPLYLCPDARGTVMISDRRPEAAPLIVSNAFQTDRDQQTMVRALSLVRAIASSPPLSRYISQETGPGADVQSTSEVIRYIREHGYTTFHSVGTCKMGVEDDAVVDQELRVHKVSRLRVVDASIMPLIVSGNTNAATMMIAEKGADMILNAK